MLNVLRVVFGAIFILFLPGFAWSFVFFVRRELQWIERIAISLGLSIVLVPLSVFVLALLFHIRITLLSTSLTVAFLTIMPVMGLAFRKSTFGQGVISKVRSSLQRRK